MNVQVKATDYLGRSIVGQFCFKLFTVCYCTVSLLFEFYYYLVVFIVNAIVVNDKVYSFALFVFLFDMQVP